MLKNASILITGGAGFVGSHLLEFLLSQGYTNITTTDRRGGEIPEGVKVVTLDLTDASATKKCFQMCQPEYVINLASVATVGDSFQKAESMTTTNATLMLSVLEAVRTVSPAARLLQVSSAAVYGLGTSDRVGFQDENASLKPINPYAVSKLNQEYLAMAYAHSYDLDIIVARPFNHTGERQTTAFAIPAFAQQIVAVERGDQKMVTVGDLSAVRDFTDVKDIVAAYELLLTQGNSGEVYNIGSAKGYSMKEMLDMLLAQSTVEISVKTDTSRMRPLDIPVSIADNKKIRALGWAPEHEISTTLQRIMQWQRKQ